MPRFRTRDGWGAICKCTDTHIDPECKITADLRAWYPPPTPEVVTPDAGTEPEEAA